MKTIILVGIFLLGLQAHSDNPYADGAGDDYYQYTKPSKGEVLFTLLELKKHFEATNDSKNAGLVAEEFSHLNGMTSAEFSDYQDRMMEENDFDLNWPSWTADFACAQPTGTAVIVSGIANLANVWKFGISFGSGFLIFGTSLFLSIFADQKLCEEAQK